MNLQRNLPVLMLSGGIGSIIIGIPYVIRVFGPTEAEVAKWGFVSICFGFFLSTIAIVLIAKGLNRIFSRFLALCYLILSLLQVPPIMAWFLLSGYGISDTPLPGDFIAHWGYSAPHIFLLFISFIAALRLWKIRSQ